MPRKCGWRAACYVLIVCDIHYTALKLCAVSIRNDSKCGGSIDYRYRFNGKSLDAINRRRRPTVGLAAMTTLEMSYLKPKVSRAAVYFAVALHMQTHHYSHIHLYIYVSICIQLYLTAVACNVTASAYEYRGERGNVWKYARKRAHKNWFLRDSNKVKCVLQLAI